MFYLTETGFVSIMTKQKGRKALKSAEGYGRCNLWDQRRRIVRERHKKHDRIREINRERNAVSGKMKTLDKNGLTEAEAIAQYKTKDYPKPALTADIAVFVENRLLLIRRGGHPFLGCWALPGGFAEPGETIEETAARELEEETNLSDIKPFLVGVYSAPGRDPRGWTVSVAYAAKLEKADVRAGDDAAEAAWFEVVDGAVVLPSGEQLAFDHAQIIADAARMAGI